MTELARTRLHHAGQKAWRSRLKNYPNPYLSSLNGYLELTMSDFIANFQTSLHSSWAAAPRDGDIKNSHVEEDLKILLNDLVTINVAFKNIAINMTKEEVQKIDKEIHAYTNSYIKAASTLKNLPSPLSSEEGLVILPILQDIQTQFIELMNGCALRLPQTEVDSPGYGKFFYISLRRLIDPYYESLAAVAPATIPQSLIQEMKSAADAALQNAVAGLPIV